MDRGDATAGRTSGIPRLSKLPVLSKRSSIIGPLPQDLLEPASNDSSASNQRAQKRSSVYGVLRPVTSTPATPASRKPTATGTRPPLASTATLNSRTPTYRPPSRAKLNTRAPALRRPGVEADENADRLSSLDSFRSASRQSYHEDTEPREYVETTVESATPKPRKTSRPSLSDRTIESLQNVPATPKDRRRSSFFAPQSPMNPPSRPSSSLSRTGSVSSRPGTSDGSLPNPSFSAVKAPASARPATRTSLGGFGFSESGRRSVSAATSTKPQATRTAMLPPPPKITSPIKVGVASRTVAARPTRPRSALPGGFVPPKAARPQQTALESEPEERKPSSSSSSVLRQQIAAAKAAARKERGKVLHDSPQKSVISYDGVNDLEYHADPFNVAPRDGKSILRNRINAARMSGKLNIAALSLKSIPDEVFHMYDAAAMEESKVSWAEVVDLTRFIAADNDIDEISEQAFPDVSPEDLYSDDQTQGNQFGGLELLDLHGNQILSLPIGLRRLERLTSLNLAHNKLDNNALDIMAQIKSLRELRVGNNNITGNLTSSLCELPHLEVLDLSANRLLALPDALSDLTSLKVLNVSNNQLTALPMEALQQLPLTELNASNNVLLASLFPLGLASGHRTLRTLNVANNSLAALTFLEVLDLPQLTTLDVTNNHLAALPPVERWEELTTLIASDNKISELPFGFTDLRRLRNVNLSGNELHALPPEVADMDALESLILASNPLRYKKYLTMDASSIKRDLRARLKLAEEDIESSKTATNGHEEQEATAVASPTSTWVVRPNGMLDLSNKDLTDEIDDTLASFLQNNDIRLLNLANNHFTVLPLSLQQAPSLHTIDLSNNPLTTNYLPFNLELPLLRELLLRNCRLTTLEPLETNLDAPALQTLNVSANRLFGSLPRLLDIFPSLTTFLASDNKFTSISAPVVQGLHVVNLESNELKDLPAEIGLLWDEGLRSLEVGRNAFRVPNHRVLDKGTEAVMRWLRDRLPARGVATDGLEDEMF